MGCNVTRARTVWPVKAQYCTIDFEQQLLIDDIAGLQESRHLKRSPPWRSLYSCSFCLGDSDSAEYDMSPGLHRRGKASSSSAFHEVIPIPNAI